MNSNLLLERLRHGEVLLGLCNMYPAAGIIEGMCKDWDVVWIDGQHGQFSYDGILHAMTAAGGIGIETLIRVPSHERSFLGLYADLSPSAIMVPMVNTAAQARSIVDALRFAPLGSRSYGGRRAIDLHGRDYYRECELGIVAQIETRESLNHLDDIIGTEGVDMLFFGPDDMKVQLNLPINTQPESNAVLRDAMERTAIAAKSAGKFCGCVAANTKSAAMATEMGFQFLVGGGDIAFLRSLSAERLAELRQSIGMDARSKITGKNDGDGKMASGVYGA